MHARVILLLASVALPIIAAPVPTTNISPVPDVERRSVSSFVQDLLKRTSIIEAIPTIKRGPIDIEDLAERSGVKWSGKREAGNKLVKWGQKRDPQELVNWGQKRDPGYKLVNWGQKRDPGHKLVNWGQKRDPGNKLVNWGQKRDPGHKLVNWGQKRDPGNKLVKWGQKRDAEPTQELTERGKLVKTPPRHAA